MPFKNPPHRIREKVNFEFKGEELTAEVYLKPLGEAAGDPQFDDQDWELDEVVECIDSITGEKMNLTEGMKAAIVFALREDAAESEAIQHREVGETGHHRHFRPSKK